MRLLSTTRGKHLRKKRRKPKLKKTKPTTARLPVTQETTDSQESQSSAPAAVNPPPKSQLSRDLLLLGLKILILGVVFAALFLFVFGLSRNADMSMSPAVKDGDLVLYYRLDKNYRQSDVVVLDVDGETQIRRVVAVAGDTVDVTENGLMVNGALQQESGIYEKTERYEEGIAFPVTLKEGEIFVLGDSREHSTDSRIYGPVSTRDTLGKVITVIRRRGI